VVDGVVAHLALDTRGANEVWKLGEKSVDRRIATDDFHAGICKLAALAEEDNDVSPSSRRLFLQSTKKAGMGEEVSPDERLCDVDHHEPPRDLPA
jgi:hypothetical protein